MIKIFPLALILFCMGAQKEMNAQNQNRTEKILVVYYSWSGNTRGIARQIHQRTGGDMVELIVDPSYSTNYRTCVNEFIPERDTGIINRKLTTQITNIGQYQTVFLGFPIWSGGIPPAISLLLQQYDFSGKTIIPFCSHGGGGIGHSVSDIARYEPGAKTGDSLSIYYSGGGSLANDITAWLRKNSITVR
jgi:flavodoxin